MLEKISIDAWCSHQADRLSDNLIKRGRHAHGHPVFKGVLQGHASRAWTKLASTVSSSLKSVQY